MNLQSVRDVSLAFKAKRLFSFKLSDVLISNSLFVHMFRLIQMQHFDLNVALFVVNLVFGFQINYFINILT